MAHQEDTQTLRNHLQEVIDVTDFDIISLLDAGDVVELLAQSVPSLLAQLKHAREQRWQMEQKLSATVTELGQARGRILELQNQHAAEINEYRAWPNRLINRCIEEPALLEGYLSNAEIAILRERILNQGKVEAIKYLRTVVPCGLREAKEVVEMYAEHFNLTIKRSY